MAFQDLNNNHVTPADVTQFDLLLGQAETLIQPYLRNLTPEENSRVGSIAEKEKLMVNKVKDYNDSQPGLSSTDVDWAEFTLDFNSRRFYELRAMRLMALGKAMLETKRLHDHDNYQNALIDYAYAQYKDRTSPGLGYDTKVEEIGQFFTGGGPGIPSPENP